MVISLVVRKFLAWILAFMVSTGAIAPISTATPITYKDSDNVQLTFAAVSDTHVMDESFDAYYLNRIFEDVENSGQKMDAIVIAGDLANCGLKDEYNAFFGVLDKETVIPHKIIASGNHDMRAMFNRNSKLIQGKVEEYLNIDVNGKNYYSYDINGYTFIIMGTEKQISERAYISDEQLAFLDSELARATKDGKPAFVICHQPLANTHGLPAVWKTGDLGEQSEQVRAILTKYDNVFYLNGHLHDGIYEKSTEELAENVYSINLPTFRKDNDFGSHSENGLGYYIEVYDDEVIFTARDFKRGKAIDTTYTYELAA